MDTSTIIDIVALVALALICLVSVIGTVVRLPGTWVIIAAGAGFGWLTGWQHVGPGLLGILIGAAIVGELVELGMSAFTARRAGASRRAAWGALIGGFAGMFLFSLPMPLVGTVFGALIGCFVGALIAELTVKKEFLHGARVGTFSAIGFVLGMCSKIALAMVMSTVLLGYAAFGSFSASPVAAQPDGQPATEQATDVEI